EFGRDLESLLDALEHGTTLQPASVRLVVAVLDSAAYMSSKSREVVARASKRWATPAAEVFLPIVLDRRWASELPSGAIEMLAAVSREDNLANVDLRRWMLGSDVAGVAGRALLRQLGTKEPARPRIFISHAEADGEELATRLVAHVNGKTRVDIWYDRTDI